MIIFEFFYIFRKIYINLTMLPELPKKNILHYSDRKESITIQNILPI